MVEPKDCQQQETEGKLWCHSHLTLMARVLVTCWILFYLPLLKKWSSDVWVAVPFFFFLISLFIDDIIVQIAFWTVLTTFMYRSMLYSCTLTTKCAPKIKEIPFPFPASWTSSVISSSSSQASSFLWAHSHIWKFATWRFICRGLTVPCSRHFEEVQTLPEGANTHRHLCYSFLSDAWLWVYYTVGQAQAVVQDWIFPGISYDPEIHGVCVWGWGCFRAYLLLVDFIN